jgi:hypothetical protein
MLLKKHPTESLTSYDLIKSLAILLMIIDHVGLYFFPEHQWLRAIGRASVPIWFFLVGYAQTRDLTSPIFIGAGLVFASTFVLGGFILPLNILITIILIRLILDHVARLAFKDWEFLIYAAIVCSLLAVPTFVFAEYGSLGLLIALFGYSLRHRDQLNIGPLALKIFAAFSILFYVGIQCWIFNFSVALSVISVVLCGAVGILLYYFKPQTWNAETAPIQLFKPLLQFAGRYTLLIYVVHLILFKLALRIMDGQWPIPIILNSL